MKPPSRPDTTRGGTAVAIAAVVSLVWLAGAAILLWALGGDSAMWLAMAVAVALPLVVIWFAALLARQSAALHREADRLAEAAETMRNAANGTARPPAPPAPDPSPQPPAASEAMRLPPTIGSATNAALAAREPRQKSLPFAAETGGPAVSVPDLVRALDFPESAEDAEGIRALRVALGDPRTRRLVQASQDILTLLSEEGVYMDDLEPDRARPETWRKFAAGERGPSVASVGGIRDRSCLAVTATRMRNDAVFRDAAHHFLRLFDTALTEVASKATDADLAVLAETRTARAFMLVGRVAGIFH